MATRTWNRRPDIFSNKNALAQWQGGFNRPADTFVPVELQGGAGTAIGHWAENYGGGGFTGMDCTRELMTGRVSNTFVVSRATLGVIADLGCTVDYSQAGVVDHLVVPEGSGLQFGLLAAGLVWRRRRHVGA